MMRFFRQIYPLYVLVDILVIGICFAAPYLIEINPLKDINEGINFPFVREYSFVFALWALFIVLTFKRRSLYTTERSLSIFKETIKVIAGLFYSSFLIGAIIFFAKYKFFSRVIFLESFALLCIFLSGWRTVKRLILRELIAGGFNNMNVLIAGAGKVGRTVLEEIRRNPYWGFKVVGFLDDHKEGSIDEIPIVGKLGNFVIEARQKFVDELIVTIPSERKVVSELIRQAKKMHLGLSVVPEDFEEPSNILSIDHLGIVPILTYKERRRAPVEFAAKRIFDFLISIALTILLSPLFLIIAILIKLDSRGPVFYVQKRSGFKGRTFDFYKFRSMIKEADILKDNLKDKNEAKGDVIFKMKKDPRITRVGRFLRRYSLDEVPQIINVLKGDMGLVGPRPFPIDESKKFKYNHMERLTVRPGITGLAQIRGRSDLSFYRWTKWDLWYVNNWSFGLDVLILWKTVPAVLKGRGAY